MKNLNFRKINILSVVCFFLLSATFLSCKKTEDFTPKDINEPLAVTASDSSLQLNEANKNNPGITFKWTTGSNYKSGASITYVLELDKQGDNFASPLVNNIGKAIYSISYTTGSINTLLNTYWKAAPGKAFGLEARVYTIIGEGTAKGDTSSPVIIKVTPYTPVSTSLYILGDATAKGWDASSADSLTPDPSIPGEFHYTATLTPGQFKFITTRGSFLPSYNQGTNSSHLFYRTSDTQADDKFAISSANVYNIDLNLISLTISITKAAAPLYSKLWIVGDATPNGWNIDNPNQMKVDVFNPYIFHYNEVLKAGEFKMPTTTGNWGADFYRPTSNDPAISDTVAALVLGSTNPPDNKWKIADAGAYKISLNILYNSIHITPFTPYSSLWIVGDATPNGWNIDSPTPLTTVPGDPYTFIYEGAMTVGEFKIPTKTGDWGCDFFRPAMNHPAITDTSAPFVAHASGPADNNDYKWYIATAGNYKITFNELYETISIVKE